MRARFGSQPARECLLHTVAGVTPQPDFAHLTPLPRPRTPSLPDATKLAARALCASFGSHHPSRLLDNGPIGFLVDDPAGAAPSDDDAGVTDADLSFPPFPPPFETLPLGACLTSSVPSGGEEWRFETGRLARLADGACLLHVGDTSLLATLESQPSRSTWRDPLSRFVVDYRERFAAVGRIPTTYFKREVSAKDHEVLAGRAVQRAMLPLFPPGFPGQLRVRRPRGWGAAGGEYSTLREDGGSRVEHPAMHRAPTSPPITPMTPDDGQRAECHPRR